ncbi:5'-nucleotidase C-terminal domain-containing protein [Calditrichota bacterium]
MKSFLFICLFFSMVLIAKGNDQNLIIFYTNDMHGGITEQEAEFLNPDFPPILGGGAAAANIIFKYRKIAEKTGDAVLVFDSGDIFQGTPIGTKTEGQAIIEYMNDVGYDAVSAGNHDFDLGKDAFINLTKTANFPILSANIVDKSTNQVFSYVKPYTIIEKQGLKIGVFGLSTEATEQMSFPDHIAGLDFTAEAPAAQKAVNELREKGVDLVIALVHMGLPYDTEEGYNEFLEKKEQDIIEESYLNAMELANQVKGIDILFGGHIHKGYNEPWEDPENHTLCFQNYGNGGNLGMVTIKIDRKTKTISGYELPGRDGGLLLLTNDEFNYDIDIFSNIKEKQNKVEKGYDEVIGQTDLPLTRSSLGESPMSNLICDAMIEAGEADFSFTNFGGIRAEIRTGPITPRDIFKVLPFGNSIVIMQMKGSFLKKVVETKLANSNRGLALGGGKVYYDKSNTESEIITLFIIKGKPLDPEKMYRVAITDYLAEGNSGFDLLAEVDERSIAYTGIMLRDALTEYIQNHSPLKIRAEIRCIKSEKETSYFNNTGQHYVSLNEEYVKRNEIIIRKANAQRLLSNITKTMISLQKEQEETTELFFDPVIGSASVDLTLANSGESAMNNFICDVMRIAVNAEFAFLNFGDICCELPKGEIRHLDMFRLFPFDRKLMVMEITGANLKDLVEKTVSGFRPGLAISGGRVEFNPERVNFNRLTYFEVANNPIYPKRVYRVVTTDYLTNGNAGFDFLKQFENIKYIPTGTVLRDVVEQFIKDNSPIDTRTDKRWIKKAD